MTEEREEQEERPRRRAADQSVWQDPRTWVSVLGFLLSLSVVVGGIVANQLANLRSDVQAIRDVQKETFARQTEQIKQLQDQMRDEQVRREKDRSDQTAYNFNLKADLVRIQTKLGIPEK